MAIRKKIQHIISLLGILFLFVLGVTAPSFATGEADDTNTGVVSDKTNIEDRGPGNLDSPMEKTPPKVKATPSPSPTPKVPEKKK